MIWKNMLLIEIKSILSKLSISNYYVRVVYKVVNDEFPPELSDLFIDDGAYLKGVYIKHYERNQPK